MTSPCVLELGNYIVPAFGGMILSEQGYAVTKWTRPGCDPILSLHRGAELWAWVNHGKMLEDRHPRALLSEWPVGVSVVLDNFRPDTLTRWGIDPAVLARQQGVVWVSMRSEVGDRSFDLIAQARSWMEYAPWVPFWAGDTIGGLWLAFKALAMHAAGRPGHYVLGQASLMQKLVEGELVLDAPRNKNGPVPWETEPYRVEGEEVVVQYRDDLYREPVRDRVWKLANLWHDQGRMRV